MTVNIMRKICIALLLAAVVSKAGAQSSRFADAMLKNTSTLDTAKSLATYQNLANTFERMADAEKLQWQPYYYASYCLVKQAYMAEKKNSIDDIADRAELLATKADSLSPGNSEVMVLMSMVNSCRISVNPMNRGKKYGAIAATWLSKAEKANADNPRIYLQRGNGFYYTPKMFGGGKEKARVQCQLALEKFKTFKPAQPYAPHWGFDLATEMLKKCDQ